MRSSIENVVELFEERGEDTLSSSRIEERRDKVSLECVVD